jgi:cytochrome P450 family 6
MLSAETLRKYPPGSFLARECTKKYDIPGRDITIEKGTLIIIPVIGLHRDQKYYPDPEKFDPDRFSEEMKDRNPQFTYLPFGEGPRICIGK